MQDSQYLHGLTRSLRSQRGIALVITLSVLAIVLLLVTGFAVSMRTERNAASNFTSAMGAKQFAQSAIAEALFVIKTNTPVISGSTSYITHPGKIVRSSNGFHEGLYSISGGGSFNINADQSIIASNSAYANSEDRKIFVDWITIGSNGQAAAVGNPAIGRYAYWIDDEASKININVAARRFETYAGSTSNIDLTVLNGIAASNYNNTATYARSTGFFTTEQWKSVSGIASATYSKNKPYITAYSADDNLTPWGTQKVDINTATFAELTNALDNAGLTSWSTAAGYSSSSFRVKYGDEGVNQIAANIIDFRDAGSGGSTTDGNTYAGLEKTLYLNEIFTTAQVNTNTMTATIEAQFELINPYGVPNGQGYQVIAEYEVIDTASSLLTSTLTGSGEVDRSGNFSKDFKTMAPKAIELLNTNAAYIGSLTVAPTIQVIFTKLLLKDSVTNVVDISVNLTNPPSGTATIPLTGSSVTFAIGVNDPRANNAMNNPSTGETQWSDTGVGTDSAQNSSYSLGGITLTTATDLTNDGTETGASQKDHSTYFVKDSNFTSLGELGFIHTGRTWRTLRLQPGAAGNELPDWLMLDIFKIGDIGPTNIAGQVLGRLNLNQDINAKGSAPAAKTIPLKALFEGSAVFTNTEVSVLLTNIVSHATTNGFRSVGEICEVDGLANAVATGVSDVQSNREARAAAIANLVTVRSNTFTVWAVGQALQEVGTKTNILAEAKAQAVIERYVDAGQAKYRTIYFRYLTE